jgi:hypothetical protein
MSFAAMIGLVAAVAVLLVVVYFARSTALQRYTGASPQMTALPEIESVVVTREQAIVKPRRYDGEGMIITFGTMTNRWTPGSAYLDHIFEVNLEGRWLSQGVNWTVKSRHGIYASYRLDGPPGSMLGKVVFHPGTPAPEADGSYVIGEFQPETGSPLPIAVSLVRDSERAAPSGSTEIWSPTLAPGEKPDPEKIRSEAQELMERGSYEESLQRVLWYHNHALEIDPSYSAVRISFALSDWTELARRYPKARQAMIETRDRGTRAFAEGHGYFQLFMEVVRLNERLQDEAATEALFKSIEHSDPTLAKQCAVVLESDAKRRAVATPPPDSTKR